MKHQHGKKMIDKIAEELGSDFDSEVIEEVAEHMKNCPDCKIYVDSVKQTIKIYRVSESDTSVPEEVSDRLFKTLKLD